MKKLIYLTLLLLFLISSAIKSQPSFVFNGGDGIGYSMTNISSTQSILVAGGVGDGYSSLTIHSPQNFLTVGGVSDGYYSLESETSVGFLTVGGEDDGYVMKGSVEYFIWTGAVGTGWTVAENWSYNIVPDINRPVIIPDGVPNYPYVNTGLFNIGDNPNNGTYKCASLWIQENAFLQTRVNCRIENYGLVTIDGEMRVKKTTADAFQNFATGVIIVNEGGELMIKP